MSTKLNIDILINDKAALSKLKRSMGALGATSKRSVDSMNLSWTALASKMLIAQQVLRTVQQAFDATVGAAIKFESAFAGVRKTVDATEAEFAKLRRGLLLMTRTIPSSVNELAKIQELAGQLGVTGVENLTKFTSEVAKIAVTTNLTQEAAATSFARISNIMQEPISNIDRMASSVVDLGNNFATTESEIVTFATRIAGVGRIAGLTTSDIFGIGAAFSSVGVQAESGGTAVQKVLIELKKRGFEGKEAFLAFVKLLQSEGDNAIKILEDMGLSNARTIRSFLALAGAGNLLERSLITSAEAFEANIALAEEAEKRFGTTASKTQLLFRATEELAISVGEGLKPAYEDLVETLTNVIAKMNTVIELGQRTGDLQEVIDPTFKGEGLPPQDPEGILADVFGRGSEGMFGGGEGGGGTFGTTALEKSKTDFEALSKLIKDSIDDQKKGVKDLFLAYADGIKVATASATNMFAKTSTDIIFGITSAEEGFKKLGVQIAQTFVQMTISVLAQKALMAAFGPAIVSIGAVTGASLAASAAPAAALMTLASGGANIPIAQAGIISTVALANAQALTGIRGFQEGGRNLRGGAALVGEAGPEIVNLPSGANVIPNHALGGKVEVHFHGPVTVRDEEDINQIALEISTILDTERSRL